MEELGLPERLFQIGQEPCGRHRVNKYFTLGWIENIKIALTDEQLEMLAESQFGRLMQMGNHTFSVMFVHHLLSRQLVTKKEYELWWVYAGKPIRYGIEEFAIVTGLLCGEDYGGLRPVSGSMRKKGKAKQRDVGGEGKVWKSLFGKEEKITPDWIHDKLLLGKKYKDDDTRFRLALILLVEGILCPTSAVTLVRPEVVEMTGEVERFLKYPWGRESFLMTVQSAKMHAAPGKYVQETVAIQGFAHAIILVTVCCCPQIIAHDGDDDPIMAKDISIEDLVQAVCERSLIVNPQTACNLDKKGQATVRSILHNVGEGSLLGFQEEVDDPDVDHMLQMIAEQFPFEPNSWRGGVKAAETTAPKRRTVPIKERRTVPIKDVSAPSDHVMAEDNDGGKNSAPIRQPDDVRDEGEIRQRVSIKELLRMAGNEYEERAIAMFAGYASSVKDHFDSVVGEMRAQFTSQLARMELQLSKKDAGSGSADGGEKIIPRTRTSPPPEVIHNVAGGAENENDKSNETTPTEPISQVEGRTGASSSEFQGGEVPTQECESTTENVHVSDQAAEQVQDNVHEEVVDSKRGGLPAEGGVISGGGQDNVEQPGVVRSSGSVAGGDKVPMGGGDGVHTIAKAVGVTEGPVQEPANISESVEKDAEGDCSATEVTKPNDVTKMKTPLRKRPRLPKSKYTSTKKCNKRPKVTREGKGKLADKTVEVDTGHARKNAEDQLCALISGYFPFEPPCGDRIRKFLTAVDKEKTYNFGGGLELPNTGFISLFDSVVPQRPEVADMVVELIKIRRDRDGSCGYDFVPASFFSTLEKEYSKFLSEPLKATYVFSPLARLPLMTRQKWGSDVWTLYCPLQIERQHWVGVMIDLKQLSILVLDCNTACASTTKINATLKPLSHMLPYLLRLYGEASAFADLPLLPIPVTRLDLKMLCEVTGLSCVASMVLMELHVIGELQMCKYLTVDTLREAAKNYAVDGFSTFAT